MLSLIGLLQGSATTLCLCYIYQMNLVNSHSGSAMKTAPQTLFFTITILLLLLYASKEWVGGVA